MRILLLALICVAAHSCSPLSYPVNVGREYGNPSMPWMVSHIPARNQVILTKHSTPRHHLFNRILCFKSGCRLKIGRQKSLKPVTFETFKKRIAKNAKKGEYNNYKRDSTLKPIRRPVKPIIKKDSVIVRENEPIVESGVLKQDSLITLSDVLFEINRATLKSEHFGDLESVVKYMVNHPSMTIKISGHTDNTGTISHNKNLSYKRAEVVAEYLIDNGVALDRVSFEGLGASKPIGPNTTSDGRKKNRRVELLIHDKR